MFKKGTLLVFAVLMLMSVGSLFGEEGGANVNSIGLDIAPLFRGFAATDKDMDLSAFGIGAYYERAMNDNWTFGAKVSFITFSFEDSGYDTEMSIFSLGIMCRYYPFAVMERLFFGFGVGIDTLTVKVSIPGFGSGSDDDTSLNLHANVGYRMYFNNNIFIEPLFGYKISKIGMMAAVFDMPENMLGASGFHIDLSIGYRF